MPLRVCILETDILRPELVDQYQGYGRMFEQLFAQQPVAAEFSVYNVVEGHYPPDSEQFDAYLVTGSKADSFGSDPWIQTLKEYLLERYKRGDKLLGICFGHQLLALLLGGKAEHPVQGQRQQQERDLHGHEGRDARTEQADVRGGIGDAGAQLRRHPGQAEHARRHDDQVQRARDAPVAAQRVADAGAHGVAAASRRCARVSFALRTRLALPIRRSSSIA